MISARNWWIYISLNTGSCPSWKYLNTAISFFLTTLNSVNSPMNSTSPSSTHRCQFDPKVGQIVPKWGKSGTFSDQISVHFGALRQNVPKSDLKKSQIFPILGQFDPLLGQIGNPGKKQFPAERLSCVDFRSVWSGGLNSLIILTCKVWNLDTYELH